MKVAEIFAELGFNIKDANLGEFINSLSKIDLMTVTTAAGLGSIYLALNQITTASIQAAHELANFSKQTGLSSEELQRWQLVGERAGITAEEVTSAFKGIQSSLTAISKGGGNTAPFSWLGLNAAEMHKKFNEGAKGSREALFDLSRALSTASEADKRFFASQMGVSDAFVQLLASGKATNEMLDLMPVMSDSARDSFDDLRSKGVELNQEWGALLRQIAQDLQPVLDGLVKVGLAVIGVIKEMKPYGDLIKLILLAALLALAPLMPFLTALGILIASILAVLGTMVHYWDAIKAAAQDAGEAVSNFFDNIQKKAKPVLDVLQAIGKAMTFSPLGLGAKIGQDQASSFIPSNMNDGRSNDYSQSNQQNSLTVNLNGGGDQKQGLLSEIEDQWNKLIGRGAYQRKLKAT